MSESTTNQTTVETNSTTESGLCIHCVTGFRIPGIPKGTIEKINGINVYVSTPSATLVNNNNKAILFFTDVFGLNLDNNKILSDKISDSTGLKVFVPDLFQGDCLDESSIGQVPSTVEEVKKQSYFSKIKMIGKFATLTPWFVRHRTGKTVPQFQPFVEFIKSHYGYDRLGGIGFCYGGKHVIAYNGANLIDVSVANHPSFINMGDIEKIQSPILFNCAEDDHVFSPEFAEKVKTTLDAKENAPVHLFHHYPNTVHGFSARPNLADPLIKQAFEQTLSRAVDFFKAHL